MSFPIFSPREQNKRWKKGLQKVIIIKLGLVQFQTLSDKDMKNMNIMIN